MREAVLWLSVQKSLVVGAEVLISLLWPVNTVVLLYREMLGSELMSTSDCMNMLSLIGMRVLIPLRAWACLRLLLRASAGAAWTWYRTLPLPLGNMDSWECS